MVGIGVEYPVPFLPGVTEKDRTVSCQFNDLRPFTGFVQEKRCAVGASGSIHLAFTGNGEDIRTGITVTVKDFTRENPVMRYHGICYPLESMDIVRVRKGERVSKLLSFPTMSPNTEVQDQVGTEGDREFSQSLEIGFKAHVPFGVNDETGERISIARTIGIYAPAIAQSILGRESGTGGAVD